MCRCGSNVPYPSKRMQPFIKSYAELLIKNMQRTLMACLWSYVRSYAGSTGIQCCWTLPNVAFSRQEIRNLWIVMLLITNSAPQCGAHDGEKTGHMAPRSQVTLQPVCCILFDVCIVHTRDQVTLILAAASREFTS